MKEERWEKINIKFESIFCDHFESVFSRFLQWKREEDKGVPYAQEVLDFFKSEFMKEVENNEDDNQV